MSDYASKVKVVNIALKGVTRILNDVSNCEDIEFDERDEVDLETLDSNEKLFKSIDIDESMWKEICKGKDGNGRDCIDKLIDIFSIGTSGKDLFFDPRVMRMMVKDVKAHVMPILVGLQGSGKTFTVENCSEFWLLYKNIKYKREGIRYKHCNAYKIQCSGIPYIDLWSGMLANGKRRHGYLHDIYDKAVDSKDTLFYVVLNEFKDIDDPRAALKDMFEVLPRLPDNLIIVATGNNTSVRLKDDSSKLRNDQGVNGRVDEILMPNILDFDNQLFDRFFDYEDAYFGYSNFSTVVKGRYDKARDYCIRLARSFANELDDSVKKKGFCLIPREVHRFLNSAADSEDESDEFYLSSIDDLALRRLVGQASEENITRTYDKYIVRMEFFEF